ncbi:hypothetical protein BJV77DRAFT_1071490 [Russula vinacea]|nr:hypothetical protein BJV77DRAFT_1071490 [Russula vinacea]
MDFFAPLFTITSNAPEPEPEPSTPIDADGGDGLGGTNTGGCIGDLQSLTPVQAFLYIVFRLQP